MRAPGLLVLIEETWHARRASREMLGWHSRIAAENRELGGRALYQRILVRRNGIDERAAEGILRRSLESASDWEADRELRYRDVVLYTIVEEYIARHPERRGARARMGRAVARVIARDL